MLPTAYIPTRYNGNFTYEYHLKDHLGSVRVAFVPTTSGTEIVQENAYYPFGAPIAEFSYNTSENRYLREGKEYIDDFDWNKYDFLARTFDSWILQPLQIDPLCEKYYHISPYALWGNNPILHIDPTGMEVWSITDPEEIKRIVADLNRIYAAKYGNKEGAFSFRSEEKSKKVCTNPFSLFSPSTWFAEREYINETYTEHVLVANSNFDWSRDEYTKAMKEVLEDQFRIELIVDSDADGSFIKTHGGGREGDDKKSVILSSKLADFGTSGTTDAFPKTWAKGAVLMHELIYHFHEQGLVDAQRTVVIEGTPRTGESIMRAYYRTRTQGTPHGPNSYYKIKGK